MRLADLVVVLGYLVYVHATATPIDVDTEFAVAHGVFALFVLVICQVFRLYAAVWRFASVPDLANVLLAAVTVTAAYAILVAPFGSGRIGLLRMAEAALVTFALLALPRVLYKVFRDYHSLGFIGTLPRRGNAIVIGYVGDASGFVGGFVDPDGERVLVAAILSPKKASIDRVLQGVPVLGMPGDLRKVVERFSDRGVLIRTLIIASPLSLDLSEIQTAIADAHALGLRVLTFDELPATTGRPAVPAARAFAPEELLMRSARLGNEADLSAYVSGRRFLVTGGGGSIGSTLVEALVKLKAREVVVVDISEGNIAALLTSGRVVSSDPMLKCFVGDVRDAAAIGRVVRDVRPDVVIHAAALKHVDLVEKNVVEAYRTNVMGTIHVADACLSAGVDTCVLISTDKAVEPVSVLGLTKRVGEIYFEALMQRPSSTRFVTVRFGNVLGSAGSAVPLFLGQIQRGGPVKLTSDEMIRYFMTTEEARDLILTVSAHADAHPDISLYVLDTGKPIRIRDLVERLIRLSGLEPGRDIEIEITGPRPGEKMTESLFFREEEQVPTDMPFVVGVKRHLYDLERLRADLTAVDATLDRGDDAAVRAFLVARATGTGDPVAVVVSGAAASSAGAPR